MTKTFSIFIGVICLTILGFAFAPASITTPDKITICHMPPGNTDNCQEITISINALDAHTDHHDDMLVCNDESQIGFYVTISNVTGIPVKRKYMEK